MTRIIMHGCNGRMGQVITGIVANTEGMQIVAGVDMFNERRNSYPVFTSIEECDIPADVVIDFSNAAAVNGLLKYCVEKQLPVVLCTTGLSEDQLAAMRAASEKVAILKNPQ